MRKETCCSRKTVEPRYTCNGKVNKVSLYQGFFPNILQFLGLKIALITPRTSLYIEVCLYPESVTQMTKSDETSFD